MSGPRILTFNFHEPYLCLMAKTGLEIEVGEYSQGPLARRWHMEYRPVPSGVQRVSEGDWRARLHAGKYDAIVAQNESNAADILADAVAGNVPRLLVCHNRRNFLERNMNTASREAYTALLDQLAQQLTFVFISQTKMDSYGIVGEIIYPGIDLADYSGYAGDVAEILRVGNAMVARDCMFDVDLQERVCAGLPNRIVGDNPGLPASRPSQSWDHLRRLYQSRRCLLHVTREAYEDGYNLAMLEAMATGMPVVALANATSPLTNGADGLLGADTDELRGHCERLLQDVNYARKLGAAGRDTVARKFPMATFAQRWQEVVEAAADTATFRGGQPHPMRETSGHAVALIEYVSSPFTTGRHVDAAARRAGYGTIAEFGQPPQGETVGGARAQEHAPGRGVVDGGDVRFASGGYYRSARPELMPHIPIDARRLLDVGCGGGELGRALKARGALEVVGIEVVERAAELARRHLDDVLCLNVEHAELPFADAHFDCIICADVLEHMVDPAAVIHNLARVLRPGGSIVISIPNVRFFQVVGMLAEGRWRYEDAGIMDRTHLRFFTRTELAELMVTAGLETKQLAPLSIVPPEYLPLHADGSVRIGRVTISDVTDADYEEFRTFQYLVVACKQRSPLEGGARRAGGVFGRNSPETCAALSETLEEEFDALCEALDADFDDLDKLIRASELAAQLGRLKDVRPFLERYADFYPANVRAVTLLADVLHELGEHAAADARLQMLYAIRPDAAVAREGH